VHKNAVLGGIVLLSTNLTFISIIRQTQLNVCCIFALFDITTCFGCPDQPS